MASPSGNLLAGRYRTIKRLGSGGMATVLLAEDQRLGRAVAVKRMHSESPEEVAKRFQREAHLGAAMNHPNIVAVFDIETDDENVLIVMEYVPGGTLKDALARGPLERDTALKVLKGVAAALDYAHEHGVVHRDIKPANVLLDDSGRAKVADLGIATAAEVTSITKTGAVLGTASYMAPERLDGEAGGKEADIYALATVAYETLTGRKARQGRSAVEIAAMVMSDPPPDLRDHAPDSPEAAADVLMRGMSRDPADRQESAGELVRELCEAFAAEEDEEPDVAPAASGRNGAGAAGAAAAAAGLGAAAAPDTGAGATARDTGAGAVADTGRGKAPDTGRGSPSDTGRSDTDGTPGGAGPAGTAAAAPEPTYRRQRASRRPAAAPSSGAPSDRRWLLPVLGLVVALLAVGVVLALAGGDDSGQKESGSSDAGDVRGDNASGSNDGGDSAGGQGGAQSGSGASGSSGGAAGGSGASGAGSAGGEGEPAQAVKDFYTLAAKDDFEEAWKLAGPGVQEQLGGYDKFVATLDTLESIDFPKLKTTTESGDSATVQLASVATHTNRVDRCNGTVQLTGGSGGWKLEHLNVGCGGGSGGGGAPEKQE